MYIGNVMLLGLNLPLIGLWVRLLKVPYHYLAVLIVVIVMIGAYSLKNAAFDVGMIVIFGGFGYVSAQERLPLRAVRAGDDPRTHPGAVRPAGAQDFRAALMIFIERPISATLLAVALLVILIPVFKWGWQKFLLPKPRKELKERYHGQRTDVLHVLPRKLPLVGGIPQHDEPDPLRRLRIGELYKIGAC